MEEPDHSVDQRGRASASTTTTENEERSHHRRHIRRPPSATSKTPRRRNTNPQSSSPPRRRDDDDDTNFIKDDGIITNDSNNDEEPPQPSSPLATPLTTLTTLLQTSHTHQQTLLTLFRTSHSLHLHAIDRKHKAIESLRLAQAELEHATTAEEFAMVELQRSKVTKDGACGRHDVLRGEVHKLASGYNGVRVKLVNLTSNSNWNGRCGTIVNMIDNGEDLGRWKVRLDSDWRGKEPDGNYSVGDGGGGSGEGMLSQDWEHVVAKAENLKLIDGMGGGDVPSFLGDGRSQQVDSDDVTKSRSTSRSPSSLDDGKGKHHPLDPVEELPEESYNHNIVTPERRGGRRRIYNSNNSNHQPSSPPQQHGDEYDWKRNALGSQHSPPGYYEPDDHHQFVHHRHAAPVMHHHSQVQKRQEEPPQQKQQLQRIHGHQHQQSKQQQQHQQKQQEKHYVSPRASKRSPKSSPNMQQQQQQIYNRNQVSSFSEMVSPESFAPISFQIETSESFSQRDAVLPPSSSFFEEVTPREDTQNVPNHQHYRYQEESHEERSNAGPHSSLQAPSTHSNSLPTVVVLPVDNEDEGNRNGPPTCVGVQNAGISHVNGLYVLAPNNHQDDDEEESSSQPNNPTNNPDVPPLYFRDAEPILLSDKRHYDMCILRIDCPDSPDYVIWFLSRVDIDPDCLDVKFSDCYYYCRVLRSVGLYVPPMDGWSVPDVQQQQQQPGDDDAVAFSTLDDEASFVNDQERFHSSMSSGLGIVPRSAEDDYV
ncbi:hypothetical protein QTG54_013494 [Skeletonema marinoi]|uniref:Uncharacterized protein n=1 Tax=Skeletonema marinoi TaxID=267567 RepID=A0AAD8XY09_9STRA|nr:hypothetical protein QTG54_013494 [Skeletonema marinoi]